MTGTRAPAGKLNAPPEVCECSGYQVSLDDAKRAIVADFKKWVAWAGL